MYGAFLNYSFPILIIVALVNFIWAWIPTAVKPPEGSQEKRVLGAVIPEWRSLDGGSEGVRRSVAAEIKPQIKAALPST